MLVWRGTRDRKRKRWQEVERQHQSTPEISREDLAGTTYSTYSAASRLELMAVYDPFLHRLEVYIQSGDFVYQSEWLECENQLPTQATAQAIQEAVRLWLLRIGWRSRGQRNGWTPLELVAMTMSQFEHVLA